MSCSPYDLRDYLFDELTPPQQGEVRAHLKSCTICWSEIDALRSTHAALLTIREEEMPQRIGFVSDKVFEPSPLRRWFTGFWTSAAQLGFVSSSLLAAAILVHAFRPAPALNVQNSAPPTVTQASLSRAEIDRRIQEAVAAQIESKVKTAVTQAVSETEQNAQKRTTALLAAAEKRLDLERWAITVQLDQNRYNSLKRNGDMIRASFGSSEGSNPQ
jgi:anti-sigma factor RsiW